MDTITREEAIELLAEQEAEMLDDESIFEILKSGCSGWVSLTNEELAEALNDNLGMELIVEGSEE